jgi:hypothetical protein
LSAWDVEVGTGNFKELFRSIEEYEKTLKFNNGTP